MSLMIKVEEDNGPDTYVKKSGVDGFGLFASKDFNPGDVVVDYNLSSVNTYTLFDNDLSTDNHKRSKLSFINHSREPNCDWIVRDRVIVAAKPIFQDEELFIDYRMEPRPNRVSYPSWI